MKLRDSFVYLVKGCFVGISCLIPGASGGAIANSFGVYDKFVNVKRNRNVILIFLLPLVIGILLGLFGGSHAVNFFLSKYKIQTIFLFVGILFGGYRLTIRNAKLKVSFKTLFLFIFSFVSILLIQIFVINNFTISTSENLFGSLILGLFSGLIFLVPGFSISSILTFFNKYDYVIFSFNHLFNIKSFIVVLLFIIGSLMGIIIVSKIISYLLKKYKIICYTIISGLITASIVILLLEIDKFTFNFSTIFTSILTFLWGYILSKNYEKE